jgi:hypothetical protein
MYHRGEVLLCLDSGEELLELVVRELGSIVGDEYLWDSKMSNDILFEKSEDGLPGYIWDFFRFYPFREVINSDD